METLKKNVITVENIREEIERAKLEVPREDEDFDEDMIDYMQNGLLKV